MTNYMPVSLLMAFLGIHEIYAQQIKQTPAT
jgi:hypothetical protein